MAFANRMGARFQSAFFINCRPITHFCFMAVKPWFIFDFDSTFVQVEGLEELARIAIDAKKNKKAKLEKIETLTRLGIEGKIPFQHGLKQRIELIKANRKHLNKLILNLQKKVSPSVKRNREFFQKNASRIFIISAGFREFIIPIVEKYGIGKEKVFANSFRFDTRGNITGFDEKNVLSKSDGKEIQLANLNLKGEIVVIGDGYSDFKMKGSGSKVRFVAFTENIRRESAVTVADQVAPNFDEFLFREKLPRSHSFPKNRIHVLLLESIHPDAVKAFEKEGYQVHLVKKGLSEAELCRKIKDVSILGIRSRTYITEKVLKASNRLIAVGAFCIGTNQVDLKACLVKGVPVFNAPYSNTRSVVEMVLGEIIMLLRGIPDRSQKVHLGIWDKSASGSYELRGKTLGIVGYGNIGSQLSVLAEALGMKVLYFDVVDKLALGNAMQCSNMKDLLRQSDIVTIHVDGNPTNQGLIGKKELGWMKSGALFLNLSRGFVVDLNALRQNLDSGKIAGAAIDVFPEEPDGNDSPFQSVMQGAPNTLLTPHIGGSTLEAQQHIASFVPEKLIAYVNSGNTFSSVNFPNLQLPLVQDAHRLIHIHDNVPGLLAKINSILARHEINIVGQYLKTNEWVGYVITDINKEYDEALITELKSIRNTIRFRVLY